MIRQIAFIVRQLAKTPGFTAAALLCLSLGTGANVAVFSIANAVLSRPLPLERSQDIFLVSFIVKGAGTPLNSVQFAEVQAAVKDMDLAARTYVPVNLSDGNEAQMAESELVSANYFSSALRPALVLGRAFEPDDDQRSDVVPVIISRHFWRRRFSEDTSVIGRQIRINAHDATIIAVAPEGFTGVMSIVGPDLWIPLGLRQSLLPTSSVMPTFGLVGRLRPGQTIPQVQAQLQTVLPNLASFAATANKTRVEVRQAAGVGIPPGIRGAVINGLSFLTGVAALILAIAVSNVVSLTLIRGALREREFGIRAALGAGKARLIRDALLESLILTTVGVVFGMILAWWTTSLITAPRPVDYLTPTLNVRPDLNALWFAALVAIITGLAAGLIPAVRAGSADPLQLIRRARFGRHKGRGFKLLSGFVVTQMALAAVLAFGAGLLLKGYMRASNVELGFDTSNVIAASFDLNALNYDEPRSRLFYDRLEQRVRALPGVQEVALASETPFGAARTVNVEDPAVVRAVRLHSVSPTYFDAVGIDVKEGQEFKQSDGIVINETLARLIANGASPIGAQIRIVGVRGQLEVIGVVKDTMIDAARIAAPVIYRSFRYEYRSAMTLLVRTQDRSALMEPVRRAVASLDTDVAIVQIRTLETDWERMTGPRRQLASMFSFLGILALLITGTGIYGVVGYITKSRQHEFAVRSALGGAPRLIAWQVFRSGLSLTFWGLLFGLPLGVAISAVVRSSVFGITGWEPGVILGVSLAGITTSLTSTARAAWIAVRTDIAKLLRQD